MTDETVDFNTCTSALK